MPNMIFKGFYFPYRLGIGYPWVPDERNPNIRIFQTKEDWQTDGGAKFSTVINIMQHLLKHRRIDPPTFDPATGAATWPEPPTDVQESDAGQRKMLLYSEFPMMEQSLLSVCFRAIFAQQNISDVCCIS